jgi:hypothetical protein
MTLAEALKQSKIVARTSCNWTLDMTGSNELELKVYISDAIATDWEPIIEKKKKIVVVYQSVCRSETTGELLISDYLFETEEEAKDYDGSEFVKLLTDRPIPIEVSDD